MASVFEKIKAFNSDRVPELVLLKYAAMAEDAFRFYRGTCHLFYEDLQGKQNWEDPTRAWICGDLHPENFGTYKGDNRVVYFDLNDFDEALLAPASWELARMLTGIHLAGHVLALDAEMTKTLVQHYLLTYTQTLQSGKALAIEKETASGLLQELLRTVAGRSEKELLKPRTTLRKGRLSLYTDGIKLLPVAASLKKELKAALGERLEEQYGKGMFRILDTATRVAGTGSIGLLRYVALVLKETTGNYHLVDIKESRPSSVAPYVPLEQPEWASEAQRIITLQSRGQYVAPAWLHAFTFKEKDFVVKEMQPMQDRMELSLCKGKKKKLAAILNTMARLNAAAQLRSSGRQGSSTADDLIAFAADAAQWHPRLLHYAQSMAGRVLRQYDQYLKAYEKAKH